MNESKLKTKLIRIDTKLHKSIKVYSARKDKSIKEVVERALIKALLERSKQGR